MLRPTARPAPRTLITNVTVLDPRDGYLSDPNDVLLQNGCVKEIRPVGRSSWDGKLILNGNGGVALPGLIDCHLHMCGVYLTEQPGLKDLAMVPGQVLKNLRAMTDSGVTTVRDMAGPLKLSLWLRALAKQGRIVSPRLLVPGPILTAPGGYPTFTDPLEPPVTWAVGQLKACPQNTEEARGWVDRLADVKLGGLIQALLLLGAGCVDGGKTVGPERLCGNQVCEEGETAILCPEDCGCGNFIVNDGEDCDGPNLDGQSCIGLGYRGGTLTCSPQCDFNTIMCIGNVCGNDLIEVHEHCEGTDLDGQSCSSLGFDSGILTCSTQCTFDTSGCEGQGCGDGVKDPGEDCDGADLGGADCTDVGYASGTLACTGTCTYDTSGCDTPLLCGNGVVDQGEECDDGEETASCDLDCTLAQCSDGLRNQTAGEDCDDGGETAACDTDCTPAECLDGTVNMAAGETCDDGNNIDGDGCSAICIMECDPTENIALTAGVIPSSSGGGETQYGYGPEKMVDGYLEPSCSTENFHWIDALDYPNGEWIELEFPGTVTVARVEFDTTEANDNTCSSNTGRSLAGGDIQWWDGAGWVTAGTVSGQTDDWDFILPAPASI